MKILIATGLYPPESGGPATYTKLLEDRLPARGCAVFVLPFKTVRHLPRGVRHAVYFFKCFARARAADIVYAQDTVSVGFPAVLAAMVAGKKFVVRVPGDYAWEQAQQRFGVTDSLDEFQKKSYGLRVGVLRAVQRFVVRRARAVVVPSKYMEQVVGRWTASECITTIYSSVDTPRPKHVERPAGFLVVSAARRVPWKGLEALERVVAREQGWKLFIADNLEHSEALGWIEAANVFVLNSTYEGLSHTLIEAMMLGTPVVATNVGGNPELIRDGVDGILIPPKDDEALHGALKAVERGRDSARVRAEAARERAKEFSADVAIGRLEALLKQL